MVVKPRRKPGVADVSDLTRNEVVRWQHKYYLTLVVVMGFLFPTVVAGLGWGDWQGGYIYAALLRLCFVHHVRLLLHFIPMNCLTSCI
jgi:stearoyl-CoA desaturase (delta-9 desaturase)